MDQEQASEALSPSTSISPKKLNAKAPEFVPRSSAAAAAPQPRPRAVLRRVYARPPLFVPAYYGLGNYYQQNTVPFNASPVSSVELEADRNNGGAAAAVENELPDGYLKILNQVEFYFSDINLATTDQLFRFMCNDPEGYVPLSAVASFKKIRSAISGSSQLSSILQSSKKLLVGEDGKKVKRLHPLTESDMEELQSRIIIAENLPEDHSHQNLMKIFSSVGIVKSIRTCPPHNSNNGTSSASKSGKGNAVLLNGEYHAYVEYESVELAEKAVVELTDEHDWRNGLKVRLLLKSMAKSSHGRTKKVGNEGGKDETATVDMQYSTDDHLEDSISQSDSQFHLHQLEDKGRSNPQRKGRFHNHGYGKIKGKGRGHSRPQHPTNEEGSNSRNPAMEVSVSSDKFPMARTHPVPRMPDGTRGFGVGRGKPVAVKIA